MQRIPTEDDVTIIEDTSPTWLYGRLCAMAGAAITEGQTGPGRTIVAACSPSETPVVIVLRAVIANPDAAIQQITGQAGTLYVAYDGTWGQMRAAATLQTNLGFVAPPAKERSDPRLPASD